MVGMSQLNDGDDGDEDDSTSEVGSKTKFKRHHQQSGDGMYSQFADNDDDDDGDEDSGSGRKIMRDDSGNDIENADDDDDDDDTAAEDEMMTLRQQALLRPATELRDRLGHAKLELSDLARESVEFHK